MFQSLGAATARAAHEVSATLHVPLFCTLLEQINTKRRLVVLDLGSAQTQTISLFGHFRCRMDIADIADGLESLSGQTKPAVLAAAAEALLPSAHTEPADIVLCWDLLNYIERPALGALMAAIANRSRPGALAHGLIVYRDSQMPTRPGRYVPLEDRSLQNLAEPSVDRPAPRYSQEDLTRCMPAYAIERGRLLGNGMQEFLFRRQTVGQYAGVG
jgi:hypothetical protein